MTSERDFPSPPVSQVSTETLRNHRKQTAWQIGLPLAVGGLILLGLGLAAAWTPTTSAQGGSTAVIFLAGLCMLGALPWLVILVALVLVLHRAPAALHRAFCQLSRGMSQAEDRVRRLSNRAVAPWLRLAGWQAGAARLWRRLSSRKE